VDQLPLQKFDVIFRIDAPKVVQNFIEREARGAEIDLGLSVRTRVKTFLESDHDIFRKAHAKFIKRFLDESGVSDRLSQRGLSGRGVG
jgi:hypothetical protein